MWRGDAMRPIALLLLFICSTSAAEIKIEKIVDKNWLEIRTENFIVVTDAKEKLAQKLVVDLENFRYFISVILNKPLIKGIPPLKTLAISSKSNFKVLDLPENWAGVFQKSMDGNLAIANISGYSMSAKNKDWGNQILMHEYVHFASQNTIDTAFYPMWYSEGMAEYLATFRSEDDGKAVSVGRMDVVGDRIWSLRKQTGTIEKIDIEDLIKTKDIEMNWRRDDKMNRDRRDGEKKVSKFYARALVAYHYLQSSKELSMQSAHYFRLINQGKRINEAFNKAFSTTYQEMDDAIHKYITGRFVYATKFSASKDGINFPPVKIEVRKLSTQEIYSELAQSLARFSVFKKVEIDSILALAKEKGKASAELDIAQIIHQRNSGELTEDELFSQVESSLQKYPNNADLFSLQAQLFMERAVSQYRVGHPDADNTLQTARNLARRAIHNDLYSGRAFYVLGTVAMHSGETHEKLLQEAAIALDSAKLLTGFHLNILWNEIEANMLLNKPDTVLSLLRQYSTMTDTTWINEGYGRFVIEALELRSLALSQATTNQASTRERRLRYEDGSVYDGELVDGLPHGHGKLTAYFGATFQGSWNRGMLQGEGEFLSSSGHEYRGQFADGLITGHGKIRYPAEGDYADSEGDFLMAMEHGTHRYEMRDGTIVEGQSYLGRYHGLNIVRRGGHPDQQCDFVFSALRQEIDEDLIFVGGWNKDYQVNGNGLCYDKLSGRIWECEFKDGKAQKRVNG
jgi:hypothetical protein